MHRRTFFKWIAIAALAAMGRWESLFPAPMPEMWIESPPRTYQRVYIDFKYNFMCVDRDDGKLTRCNGGLPGEPHDLLMVERPKPTFVRWYTQERVLT